jgi:hypothetical protein
MGGTPAEGPPPDGTGGGTSDGAFGFSLNLFASTGAAALTSAAGAGEAAGVAIVGPAAAGAAGDGSETKNGGGAGGVTNGAGARAEARGHRRSRHSRVDAPRACSYTSPHALPRWRNW